ncbi:hypothetical protein OOK27_27805 [Streptomyces canus]|uniref:hypothetical protein n=1 Tax=Streptomyces canus TaxID=58343 RepID=UPI0022561B93|nr:hypothetical protein [Streptomyces canus]MCX5257873.1 hypothetical protein [Streptomyces canus]
MWRKFGLHASYGSLLFFLFVDGVAFLGTAIYDATRLESSELILSVLLRLVVGPLNLAAFIKLLGKKYRVEHYAPLPAPPSIPVVAQLSNDAKLAFFAQAAAAPLLFIPIWIEVQSPIHGDLDMLFVYLAFAAFLFAAILIAFGLIRGVVSFGWVAVGAILPLVGVVQFVYVNLYKPTHDRPSVDVSAKLRKLGTFDGVAHMQATIDVYNHGSGTADVLGAMYAVTGHRVAFSGTPASVESILDGRQADGGRAADYVSTMRAERLLPVGQDLAQGEKWSRSFVFDARETSQDAVRLTVYISLLTHSGQSLRCRLIEADNVCDCTFPQRGLVRNFLGDTPRVKTYLKRPNGEPPYIQTQYWAQKKQQHVESVESINLAARDQFTQTVTEYRLD